MDRPWNEFIFNTTFLAHLQSIPAERTRAEVELIEQTLAFPLEGAVLDLGCGAGRHAIEMAARGHRVVGLDRNSEYLIAASDSARKRGLAIEWVCADMRCLLHRNHFAACYSWYHSIGYFGSDDEDTLVLSGVYDALIPGGRFAIDVINVLQFVRELKPRDWQWHEDGSISFEEMVFDPLTGRSIFKTTWVSSSGERLTSEITLRLYSPKELISMLRHVGFGILEVWGDTNRSSCTMHSPRCIVLAEKTATIKSCE
jgi:SAM-dependent methyltransferase